MDEYIYDAAVSKKEKRTEYQFQPFETKIKKGDRVTLPKYLNKRKYVLP